MSTLHRDYWKIDEQLIRVSVSFNKQLTNWATSQPMKIGYRVSVTPIKRTDIGNGMFMEEFEAFTGFGDTLLEVDRQSAKRLQSAINVLNERKEMYLNHFKK